jgi:hypothetical protein
MTEPTPEMLAALQSFADRNGRYWKEALSTLWSNGRDYYEPEGAELHSVRNNLGPSWLYDHCKVKPAPKPKRPPVKRITVAQAFTGKIL